MMFDTIYISSDDEEDPLKTTEKSASDDDHIPLKTVRASLLVSETATDDDLKAQSIEQCEFCEEVFLNRYDALIHNAKHIIIPLLKQNVVQCPECLFYYTSQEELKDHMKETHLYSIKLDDPTDDINHETIKPPEVKKDVKVLNFTLSDINKQLVVKMEDIIVKQFSPPKKSAVIPKTKKEETIIPYKSKERISNRLKFEDDEFGDLETAKRDLLNDLTTECKVNVDLFSLEWKDVAEANVAGPNVANVNTVTIDYDAVNSKVYTASTHYNVLVKPGMYKCKRCTETFSTRFQLIQHDTIHLRIRKPRPLLCEICERFISNNRTLLKQHMLKKHDMLYHRRSKPPQSCKKCGLKYYNYHKHMQIYHNLVYCHLCNKAFDSDEERLDHIREHLIETQCFQCDFVSTAIEVQEHQRTYHRISNVSTIRICETCCIFVKNKQNMQYVSLGSVSEFGTRLTCERCNKQFFELKLVRRLHKATEERREGPKKKQLTNFDRLKNIQQRLKMINKLSRF